MEKLQRLGRWKMVKTIIYCDRCGNVCEECRDNNGYHVFKGKYFMKKTDDNYLDLCQGCYDSLAEWMKRKKRHN